MVSITTRLASQRESCQRPPRRPSRPPAAGQPDNGGLGDVRLCAGNGGDWSIWADWAVSCPKQSPRAPAPEIRPPRTVETPAGLLNSIGLDNDGIELFIQRQLPYLAGLGTKIIVSIAGKSQEEFVEMAARLDGLPGVDALELNISCPNVSGGVDFGADPSLCQAVVAGVPRGLQSAGLAKLTPNVTSIADIARAAEAGGADAISLINTCLGMAIDWRRRARRSWAAAWAG